MQKIRSRPLLFDDTCLEVIHEDAVYPIQVMRLAAARRYTLRVRTAHRDMVLSMPKRGTITAARDFAQKHAGWIAARMAGLEKNVSFCNHAKVPLRGLAHQVEHRPETRGTVSIQKGDPPLLLVAGEKPHLNRRLTDWLKAQATKDLTAAVDRHCEALGVRYTRITLKDTVSRWGSCSPSGALAFSWRLIFAPPFVLDYLAAHEVAHLKEMNHSVRFWRLCKKLCPRTEEAKAWLKTYGATLHRYG